MTIGLSRWLRLAASLIHPMSLAPPRRIARLEDMALSERDLADLNLPEQISASLRSRAAANEARRRVWY